MTDTERRRLPSGPAITISAICLLCARHLRERELMNRLGIVATFVGVLLLAGTTGAVAGAMITGAQIKDGTVTGKDIKDKSLAAKDLSGAATKALTGPRGATGPAGADGAPGQNGYQYVEADPFVVAAGAFHSFAITCPAGTTVLGGGARLNGEQIDEVAGGPTDFDEWFVKVANPSDSALTYSAFAVCTRP